MLFLLLILNINRRKIRNYDADFREELKRKIKRLEDDVAKIMGHIK